MPYPFRYDLVVRFKNGDKAEFKDVRREPVMGALTAIKPGDTIIITRKSLHGPVDH